MQQIMDRQTLYTTLDNVSLARREEMNQHSLMKGSGLVKAFVIETSANAQEKDVEPVLRQTGWDLRQIDARLYEVGARDSQFRGYIDVLTPRYLALFTTEQSSISDPAVRRTVRNAVELDNAWFSSTILETIWRQFTPPDSRWFATLHFETEPLFDSPVPKSGSSYSDTDDEDKIDDDRDSGISEHQTDRLEFRTRLSKLRGSIPEEPIFGGILSNLTRMRIPTASEQGRCDYYYFGKMTNRGDEFRGFRANLNSVVTFYGRVTERIEEAVRFGVERHTVTDGIDRWKMRGAIISFRFSSQLSPEVFKRFIEITFERGRGPFRLWGNPIWISETQAHVYGIDLHLWQELFLDLSPARFLLVLPEQTCGNTVHRLATHLRRYIDPMIEIHIGDVPYEQVVRDALRAL